MPGGLEIWAAESVGRAAFFIPMEEGAFFDVKGGGVGAGIVHAEDFQKASIAGGFFVRCDDAVRGLAFETNTT